MSCACATENIEDAPNNPKQTAIEWNLKFFINFLLNVQIDIRLFNLCDNDMKIFLQVLGNQKNEPLNKVI
jgi:hypothetical protein